ncbi:DUF4157 domain-containing protein [Anabaena azotica FACHB-119]|uniref:DUF4157 domain-containing protein n=2 Tax=Anabaena azotica TaxID=197653 RepID=A0ABR8DCB4_9NOST|nr:DUF4157 domain-containing protein [Anabaena azotica FACHB-119]
MLEEEQLQTKPPAHFISPLLQRQAASQDEKLQTKPPAHFISPLLQRQGASQDGELQTKPPAHFISPLLQRQGASQQEELQTKPPAHFISPLLQRQGASQQEELPMKPMVQLRLSARGITATSDLETSIQKSRGSGQPLADEIKQPMEQAFGADFNAVRIHTDAKSDKLNKSIQARAFTTGQDVFFRQGEYSPGSNSGKELLAHELTHVIQQNGGAVQPKSFPNQAIKKNKIQAKALVTSPPSQQPQQQDIPQPQPEQDNQGEPEQAALKPDTQNQQEQGQAQGNQSIAATPPADEGGSVNPPPAEGGSPIAGENQGGQVNAPVNQQAIPISAEDPGQILEQLKNTPPTQAFPTYTEAETASAQALENQRQQLQASIPEIPAPTGLSPQTNVDIANNSAQVSAPSTKQPQAQGQPNPVADSVGAQVSGFSGLFSAISQPHQNQDSNQVNTSAGERPKLNLTGEADPSQMNAEQTTSSVQVQEAKTQATSSISRDFGENNIFPQASNETIKANKEISKLAPPSSKGGEVPTIPSEIVDGLNQGLTPYYQSKIAPEQEKYIAGKQKFDIDSTDAKQSAKDEIKNLNQETTNKQIDAKKLAQQEVTQAKQDWKKELDTTEKDYQQKAGKATKEQRKKVEDEKAKGEAQADQHLKQAEQKAEAEKKKAEQEEAKKKEEAEKEKEKESNKSGWDKFWGGVKSFFSSIVEGLKKAINFIYDNLRKAVKFIFEAAKKLAMAAIDLARNVIVGIIKGLGEILKGLVQVVFAAFPEISKKFTNAIDKAVNKATEVVNAAADLLKKAVSGVLDFLAKTLDTLLGLVQSLYNGALTVIGMLIRGEFAELAKRFGNLIEGAKAMPPQFEIAGIEELMGGDVDLDKSLKPEELAQAQAAGVSIPGMAGENTPQTGEASKMPSAPWTEENVGVDAVEDNMELSPELTEELMQQTQGEGEMILAESQDESRSMNAIMSEATGGQQVGAEQEPQEIPDGLTPKQRASIKWELMKQGIKQWFADNWPKLLAGLIAAAAVIIAAIVASGGAVLAALPIIMEILTVVFAAEAIAKIGGYVRDYLSKSWDGDIPGGGKSLAKALAAGAIELIMLLTFEAGKLAAKGAKAAAKGAKAAAKGAANLARKAFRGVIKGIKYVIEKGKVLFKGIAGSGVGKQFKRLKDLGKGLLERMRFKAFRIRVANGRFRLEGLINPWILLASGELRHIDQAGLQASTTGSRNPGDAVTTLAGDAGTVVSNVNNLTPAEITTLVNQGGNQVATLSGQLAGDNTLLLDLLNRTRSTGELSNFLNLAGGAGQANRLLNVLNIVTSGDHTRLNRLLQLANGSPVEFRRLANRTLALNGRTPAPTIPAPPAVTIPGGGNGANMIHFIDGHTLQHLNIPARIPKPSTTLWPRGTTPTNISNYLDEAIRELDRVGRLPSPGTPEVVRIPSGVEVQVGVRLDPSGSGIVYGQFFPTANNGFETISRQEMRAIWDIFRP